MHPCCALEPRIIHHAPRSKGTVWGWDPHATMLRAPQHLLTSSRVKNVVRLSHGVASSGFCCDGNRRVSDSSWMGTDAVERWFWAVHKGAPSCDKRSRQDGVIKQRPHQSKVPLAFQTEHCVDVQRGAWRVVRSTVPSAHITPDSP